MRIDRLTKENYEEMKGLFLDVFTNEPWLDKWENSQQIDEYLANLIDNNNSLSLILYNENNEMIGGSLGYVFNWWQGKEYFIKEFFISRDVQNQGVGTLFLEKMYEILMEYKIQAITLATDKDYPAYSFYKKNGFLDMADTVFLLKSVK